MSASFEPPRAGRRRLRETPDARRRVLFIGEGSTLAHAARPIALCTALPAERYETSIAVPERYRHWVPQRLGWRPLNAQTPEVFAERLAAGKPLFSRARLEQYVAEDLALIEETRPEVVVGDFRLSLAASARMAKVPYVAISNAYWSPDRPLHPTRPVLDLFRGWPGPLAQLGFRLLAPSALRWHARPVDQLLTAHGLPGIGGDLRRAFTDADVTLYADIRSLYPEIRENDRRAFLGPIAWQPPASLPPWWDRVPNDRPIAYLTLGSSGDVTTLQRITAWLRQIGFVTLLATAGRANVVGEGPDLFVADYLPGLEACALADLVICNGGAPGTNQALLRSRPVLGIASNLDQFLNMRAVQASGVGAVLRADALARGRFERAVYRLSGFRAAKAAAAFAAETAGADPARVLAETIDRLAAASEGARP